MTRTYYTYRLRESFEKQLNREGFSAAAIKSLVSCLGGGDGVWVGDAAAQACLEEATREVAQRYTL